MKNSGMYQSQPRLGPQKNIQCLDHGHESGDLCAHTHTHTDMDTDTEGHIFRETDRQTDREDITKDMAIYLMSRILIVNIKK